MPKALIISHNEICYNARLLKAADALSDDGWEVSVFNPVTGIASEEVYQRTLEKRSWQVIENDISKRSLRSKLRWLAASLLHQLVSISVNRFSLKAFDRFFMNKGYLFFPEKEFKDYDVYIIHLIDTLPIAARLKSRFGGTLVYDSQEYFTGQYTKMEEDKHRWVVRNEARFIKEVDVLLTTTNVMKERLLKDYELSIPAFRLRNVPQKAQKVPLQEILEVRKEPLKLVWHGMAIYFNNRRGVHILVQAVAACKAEVKLFLQGNFPASEKAILDQYKKELKLDGKIEVVPAAHPDEIVASLTAYDVGLTGELPEEENQELTSSNKLFDYINAGLAVLSSNTKGLEETVREYGVGEIYEAGNVAQLAQLIDRLALEKAYLEKFKKASVEASKNLYWEKDYEAVIKVLNQQVNKA
jgi:glycosyltransferase involved in cell wall biosynthesis